MSSDPKTPPHEKITPTESTEHDPEKGGSIERLESYASTAAPYRFTSGKLLAISVGYFYFTTIN